MKEIKRKLNKLKITIKEQANLRKIRLAKLIAFNLINNTPVDTSKALSNWIANLSSPYKKTIPPHLLGSNGSSWNVSSGMAYLMAESKIQTAKIGQVIYISNNVDYILLLNMGYSNQAPKNFIEEQISNSIASEVKSRL